MQPTRLWLRPYSIRCLLSSACLGLVVAGCAGAPVPVTTIHQDTRTAVFLENVPDKSYQAAHPITLDETTVANVLRGVHTKEKTDLLLLVGKALRTTNLSEARTFFEDDIELLAPHLAAALAQAAPNQRVGFRLTYAPTVPTQSRKAGPNVETTSGYLFADSLSLHLTLNQYRYLPGKVDTTHKEPRPLPDPDGLRDREVKFLPEAALRPESADRSDWFSGPEDRTLVIDYHLLGKLLAAPPPPPPGATPTAAPMAQPYQTTPGQPAPSANDAELRAFREELKALQKKLDEQNAELQRLKESPPKRKSTP